MLHDSGEESGPTPREGSRAARLNVSGHEELAASRRMDNAVAVSNPERFDLAHGRSDVVAVLRRQWRRWLFRICSGHYVQRSESEAEKQSMQGR